MSRPAGVPEDAWEAAWGRAMGFLAAALRAEAAAREMEKALVRVQAVFASRTGADLKALAAQLTTHSTHRGTPNPPQTPMPRLAEAAVRPVVPRSANERE